MKNLKQTELWDQVLKKLDQFKFAIAIALVGVVLLMIPTKPSAAKQDPAAPAPEPEPASQAEGYSTQEIAQLLHIPLSTVTVRLSRARQQLRDELKGWYYDEEAGF